MKTTYTLYSAEYPEGKKLAEVYDQQQAWILEQYYRDTYNRDWFKVTSKEPRKQEKWFTGGYGI